MTRNTLYTTILMTGLLLTAGASFAGGPSPAVTCAELVPGACDAELSDLCAATEAAGSLKDRDRDGLVSKVVGASIKISQEKILDAEQKLADYEFKLTSLGDTPKPKISEEDADTLSGLLIGAQICVATLP